MDKRPALALAAIVIMSLLSAWTILPRVVAIVTTQSVASGKLIRATGTQGWVGFGSTLYHNGIAPQGTLFSIQNPSLGADSSEWGAMGFSSDTAAANMTVTKIQNYDVEYTVTGAGIQRLYCLGRSPPEVTSGGVGVWSAADDTLTITTTGAVTVKVHWSVISHSTGESLMLLWQLYPIIAFFILTGGAKTKHFNEALYIMLAYTVATLISWLLYTWGL